MMWWKLSEDNTPYTVVKGDTLSQIAANRGVSLDDLLSANPGIADPDKINIGQKIQYPPSVSAPPEAAPDPLAGLSEREYLIRQLGLHEGFRNKAYADPIKGKSVPTVGYGTTQQSPGAVDYLRRQGLDPNAVFSIGGQTSITKPQALNMTNLALDSNVNTLQGMYPNYTNYPRGARLALQNMVYQMGPKSLKGFKNMNASLNQSQVNWGDVSRHAADSRWAKVQTPDRARQVISMFPKDK